MEDLEKRALQTDRPDEDSVRTSAPTPSPWEQLHDPVRAPLQRIDPRVVTMWRLERGFGLGIMGMAFSAGGFSLVRFTETPPLLILVLPLVWLCFLGLLIWLPSRQWTFWGYRIDRGLLEISHGVIVRASVLIPLSRLQHVDVSQGILERQFELASLVVHTAGTASPSHTIPGLPLARAKALRDQLVETARLELDRED